VKNTLLLKRLFRMSNIIGKNMTEWTNKHYREVRRNRCEKTVAFMGPTVKVGFWG
jgi:hypothetical protein